MQTAYNFFDSPEKVTRKKFTPEKLRVTDRDLKIVQFVIEMKFASIENIHLMYFYETKIGETSCSLIWTKQRIRKLINFGFLKYEDHLSTTKAVVATSKGYLYLKNSRTDDTIIRPAGSVDPRTFEHDLKVNNFRCELEKTKLISSWISERQLSENPYYQKMFSKEFRPDGIYTCLNNQKIAFELEISRKSKLRYRQKIKKYIDLILQTETSISAFNRVHYVCAHPNVKTIIERETRLFKNSFQIDLLSDLKYGSCK